MGTTQTSINRWINKENVVYTYNGTLFSLKKKKEKKILPFAVIDKPRGHYAKWNKLVAEGQILHNFTYVRYLK